MAGELLLEIGTEEIPSGYLEDALKAFREIATSRIKESRIEMDGALEVYGTPRRLVLICRAMADRQEDLIQEVSGPPKKVAYDSEGKPTKAAYGFAEKQGVSIDDIQVIETQKGEYLHVKKKIPGRATPQVLAEIIPGLIADIPWPKSMRWGDIGFLFVRPIHWVLALFDGDVIPFEVAGVKSGKKSRGHRFMHTGDLEIENLEDYLRQMAQAKVILDPEERKGEVEKVVLGATEGTSGSPILDPDLLTTVANVVEYPSAVCGSFDQSFLSLPAPVLITPMKEHQKYFAIQDSEKRLMPYFVAVNNTIARDESVVRRGHERVLRARLSDADFFFKEDRKRSLEARLGDLKAVVYQAELGTSFAKVQRFTGLTEYLALQLAPDLLDHAVLAAKLCKCDLVTEMVMEFPTLQGIMGREYARLDGHADAVCDAIQEHYMPLRAGDPLPPSSLGAIVGMADRMDTIMGCFAVGLEPTGTADPFALRRHSLAIIRILEEKGWAISLTALVSRSMDILGQEIDFDRDRIFNKIMEFFKERYKNMMLRSGFESDLIEAIISVAFDRIDHLRPRAEQLKVFFNETEEFESLVLSFKRVTNILKNETVTYPVDQALFKASCESRLWEIAGGLKDEVSKKIEEGSYVEAMKMMMSLKGPVDDFFEGVEILTKESEALRQNRLGLLQQVAALFLNLADFSKFSI
jgi:glycyl-tRNA synthetase beta chain